jgi:alpha-N-arabinofuranosidase
VVNPNLDRPMTTEINAGAAIASYTGTVLTGPDVHAHNDFNQPNAVKTAAATTATVSGGRVVHTFPPASVTALQITLA